MEIPMAQRIDHVAHAAVGIAVEGGITSRRNALATVFMVVVSLASHCSRGPSVGRRHRALNSAVRRPSFASVSLHGGFFRSVASVVKAGSLAAASRVYSA